MEQQGGEGAELKPGDRDYRAFVGPPAQYDVKAATQFSLLCALGLRENHNLLDVGCGSLRAGRLFIPYLGPGRYFGIEPNQWLVEEGIKENLGDDLVALRRPSFSYRDDFAVTDFDVEFDYVVAQSIFTHSGPEMIGRALHSIAGALKPDGLVAANFIESGWPARSFAGTGWHYGGKGIVSYRGPRSVRWSPMRGSSACGFRGAATCWPRGGCSPATSAGSRRPSSADASVGRASPTRALSWRSASGPGRTKS